MNLKQNNTPSYKQIYNIYGVLGMEKLIDTKIYVRTEPRYTSGRLNFKKIFMQLKLQINWVILTLYLNQNNDMEFDTLSKDTI